MSNNEQTARAFFDAMSDGGFSAVQLFFTDDYVYWAPGFGEIQDDIMTFDRIVKEHAPDGIRMIVHGVTSEGDRVAVEAESVGTLSNGVKYNNLYHYLLEFRDGKISKVKEYCDSKHLADVWGPLAP